MRFGDSCGCFTSAIGAVAAVNTRRAVAAVNTRRACTARVTVYFQRCSLRTLAFMELLRIFPMHSLKSLRADLFLETCNLSLVPDEFRGAPLVNRRVLALRPISKVLSDNIWIIVQSIRCSYLGPFSIMGR